MKKAQVKFGEAIGVIIIVSVVIFLGLFWYQSLTEEKILKIIEEDSLERTFEKYTYLINLNFIRVSENSVVRNDFSLIALRTFQNISKDQENLEFFRQNLGRSEIIVDIYNESFLDSSKDYFERILLYNNTDNLNNARMNRFRTLKTLIPVLDEINGKNYVGILSMKIYSE